MSEPRWTHRSRRSRLGAASAITLVMAFAAVSCGADGGAGSGAASGTDAPSTGGEVVSGEVVNGEVVNGELLSRSRGCAGCHGSDFGGGAGPGWVGLAGSERTLDDATVVVADTAYLTRAIADPSAEVVADYTLRMPANNLTDAEIADVVAFIESLSDGERSDG